MFNKKMVLSILIIAFVGLGAAATWASVASDTTTAAHPNTIFAGKPVMTIDDNVLSITNALPDSVQHDMGAVTIRNTNPVAGAIGITSISVTDATGSGITGLPQYIRIWATPTSEWANVHVHKPPAVTLNETPEEFHISTGLVRRFKLNLLRKVSGHEP